MKCLWEELRKVDLQLRLALTAVPKADRDAVRPRLRRGIETLHRIDDIADRDRSEEVAGEVLSVCPEGLLDPFHARCMFHRMFRTIKGARWLDRFDRLVNAFAVDAARYYAGLNHILLGIAWAQPQTGAGLQQRHREAVLARLDRADRRGDPLAAETARLIRSEAREADWPLIYAATLVTFEACTACWAEHSDFSKDLLLSVVCGPLLYEPWRPGASTGDRLELPINAKESLFLRKAGELLRDTECYAERIYWTRAARAALKVYSRNGAPREVTEAVKQALWG